MDDDKQNGDAAPDPWGDLLADGPGGAEPEFSFSFDEAAEAAPAAEAVPPPPEPEPAPEPVVEAVPEPDFPVAESEPSPTVADAVADGQLDDDLVGSWLDDGDAVTSAPTAVEPPEADASGSSSSIEIGTGRSGIVAAEEADAWGDVGGSADQPSGDTFSFDDPEPVEAAAEEPVAFVTNQATGEDLPELDADLDPGLDAGLDVGLGEAVGAAAGGIAAGAAAPARKPTKATKTVKAKKGGLGQIIGLVIGGVTAIPIVFAILVGLMWAGVNVPVGRAIGRALPESMAFVVPEKFRPGFKRSGGVAVNAGQGSPLDSLGTGGDAGSAGAESTEQAPGGTDDAPSLAVDEPALQPSDEPSVDDAPITPPGDGETFEDPLAAAVMPAVKPEPSPFDVARAKAEFEKAAEEAALAAAAADRQPLEQAVETALTAVAALDEVADAEDPARKRLLVELYKTLAAVGAESVMLERISADAGRPLAAPPQSLDGLHDRLARHRDELVRLGRNWLDFAKRPSDGVVLPVTFQSSRKVGPYWSSKVTLPQAKDGVRELTVLSRAEPAAVVGDEVVLTGMLVDGDVVWAADVRPAANRGGGGLF